MDVLGFLLGLGALIYVLVVERRRRDDSQKLTRNIAALIQRVHALEEKPQQAPATPVKPAETAAPQPIIAGPYQSITRPPATPATPPISTPAPPVRETPAAPAPQTSPQPAPKPPAPPAAPPVAPPRPAVAPAAPMQAAASAATSQPAIAPAAGQRPAQPGTHVVSRPPQTAPPATAQATPPLGLAGYTQAGAAPKKKSVSLEERVSTNWLPKLGIIILVIGVALLTASQWGKFNPWTRVGLLYLGGLGTLAGGILLERKERFLVLGRSLIAGGWAITFLVTYAISHVEAVRVLGSSSTNLILLLGVAGVMVWHTLKYNSQWVTGGAFFLGFAAVTLNPSPPFNLIAGAILVSGMTVIVLRRSWFELEVFGILASYLNHTYWLYTIIGQMAEKGPFPEYKGSVALMLWYWAVFRASYLLRKISATEEESVSTIAGLLNPLLFMAVMKYQSFHPEWAFYALLAMGAVEFTLGQLPAARRRRAPFQILSSLGAILMVAAIPFRYGGRHALALIWLAGAEAFLLAGIFTRERLFRYFGGITSFLVAFYVFGWPPSGVIYLFSQIINDQPHSDSHAAIMFAGTAAVLYFNSHVLGRIWSALFDRTVERQALLAFSFIASLFAAGAIYWSVVPTAAAVALAMLVTGLSWAAKQFRIPEMLYQACWIAVVSVADAAITANSLAASWHSIPERLLTLGLVAGLLYVSSIFTAFTESAKRTEILAVGYRWAASGLIALLIWLQTPQQWMIAVVWTAFALVLCGVAQAFRRNEFKWQALVLAIMSFGAALGMNFEVEGDFHHLSYRLISVTLVAGGTYVLTRWSPMPGLRWVYSWAGTVLLGYLAYRETVEHQNQWTAVLWVGLAAGLALAARFWKDRALLWQTHLLSLAAVGWTFFISFQPDYHGDRTQLITVLITSVVLYALTWLTKIPQVIEHDRIWQGYSWAASLVLSWLCWYQLQPINKSVAWAAFGLVLFEAGYDKARSFLRPQGYVALVCAFAHLFYSNFNSMPGGTLVSILTAPAFITAALPVPIYFWVYARLLELNSASAASPQKSTKIVEILMACLGTATVAMLVRFATPPDGVVVGYAVVTVAVLCVSWLLELEVFLYQALVMLGVATVRLAMYNFVNLIHSLTPSPGSAIWALGILAIGIPVAFRVRDKQKDSSPSAVLFLLQRPEQPLFFITVGLLTALLAIKVPSGMVTLAWGIEGVTVFLLALFAKERSFRLTGLALLIGCVGKIVIVDVWNFSDPSARYLTLIGLGAILLVVSYLYGKNREALREYL